VTTKAKFQNFNFLILHPILMQVFLGKLLSLWVIDETYTFLLFYFEKGSKRGSNFAYLEGICNTSLFCNLQSRVRTHAILVIGLYELLGNPTTM
jgi:hypothetical protein